MLRTSARREVASRADANRRGSVSERFRSNRRVWIDPRRFRTPKVHETLRRARPRRDVVARALATHPNASGARARRAFFPRADIVRRDPSAVAFGASLAFAIAVGHPDALGAHRRRRA